MQALAYAAAFQVQAIGENGCELSGGERQRISIARAFLKDAPSKGNLHICLSKMGYTKI